MLTKASGRVAELSAGHIREALQRGPAPTPVRISLTLKDSQNPVHFVKSPPNGLLGSFTLDVVGVVAGVEGVVAATVGGATSAFSIFNNEE